MGVVAGDSSDSSRLGTPNLSAAWQKTFRRICLHLRRKGASTEQAEDIAQEVGYRILLKELPFEDEADLLRLARHIANQMWIDAQRSARRRALVVDLRPITTDDSEAIDRVAALAAWAELDETDRAVLLAAHIAPTDKQDYVRRHRARERLEAIIAALSAWLIASWRKVAPTTRLGRSALALAAASVALSLLGLSHLTPSFDSNEPGTGASRGDLVATAPRAGAIASPFGRSHESVTFRDPVPEQQKYQEILSLPPADVDLTPLRVPVETGGRPTQEDDPVLCAFNVPAAGTRCVGNASDLGRRLQERPAL